MNEYILVAHLELHRNIMAEVRKKVPAKRTFGTREYTLSEVIVDDEDCLIAKYSRYAGCGDYDYETVYLKPEELYQE